MLRFIFIFSLIAVVAIAVGCKAEQRPPAEVRHEGYAFGNITVCDSLSEISFYATVVKNEGWVQHLIYLHGYQWLREQSAIVSESKLSELQHGFALLDWELWDDLWQDIESQRTKEVEVFIKHEGRKIAAGSLAATPDTMYIGDLIFLGCPYFDAVALGTDRIVDCTKCPVFPLEQKALRGKFEREGGESGYNINSLQMPAVGSRVLVIIRAPKLL